MGNMSTKSTNRFQIELDKIAESCKVCERQDCSMCSLNYRKMEFQSALKSSELLAKAKAKERRDKPLTGHARFV